MFETKILQTVHDSISHSVNVGMHSLSVCFLCLVRRGNKRRCWGGGGGDGGGCSATDCGDEVSTQNLAADVEMLNTDI